MRVKEAEAEGQRKKAEEEEGVQARWGSGRVDKSACLQRGRRRGQVSSWSSFGQVSPSASQTQNARFLVADKQVCRTNTPSIRDVLLLRLPPIFKGISIVCEGGGRR